MAENLEIKAYLPDKEIALSKLAEMGASYAATLHQVDVYFNVQHGRLKLRRIDGQAAELIFYEREESSDARLSRFERHQCHEPSRLEAILEAACGIRGIVRKRRTLWMYETTRLHFDEVAGLGDFIEIEVPVGPSSQDAEHTLQRLLDGLRMPPEAFIRASYIDLLSPNA